jgi:alkylation response protein AidB-like acyl-CoA dehydrogenase
MDLSTEHAGLRDSVRALLTKRSDSASVRKAADSARGYDEDVWSALCEQIGVAALAIPENYGGVGASWMETHLVMHELGRTLTPSPMLGSAVLATALLLELGDVDACARLLPGIASGSSIVAVCWAGAAGQWDPQAASVSAEGDSLTGETHYVLDGDIADVLVVVAATGDAVAVYEVDPDQPGITRVHTPTMDITRRLGSVRFDRARARRIDGEATAALAYARDIASIALSAEQVGGAERILQLTVDYSKVRVQFGRPIGSFQALKHRMADLHVLVEAARAASYAAASGELLAAVAKAYCSEAYLTVAAEAIQLHGGIAITWEHDAHLFFKRAHGSAHLFGAPEQHIAALAAAAGLDETTGRPHPQETP